MQRPTFRLGCGTGWLRAMFCAAAIAAAAAAHALERVDLYNVVVEPAPGDTRADIERRAAEQLLVRVTGSTTAPFAPDLAALVASIPGSSYVRSYGSLDAATNRTVVGFNQTLLERELARLGHPIWGSERPLTLAWIVVENEFGERTFVGVDTPAGVRPEMAQRLDEIRAELERVEAERGLPLELPLLDLEDLRAVSYADVLGNFEDNVVAASRRYGADAVLLGRVQTGGFGAVRWLLVTDGVRQPIAGFTVRDGLDAVANHFAARFAADPTTTPVLLTVNGLGGGDDYGRVLSLLRGLSDVQDVALDSAGNGALTLRVAVRGGAPQLERVLSLDGRLVPEGREPSARPVRDGLQAASNETLVFRLAR